MTGVSRRQVLLSGIGALASSAVSFNGGRSWFWEEAVAGSAIRARLVTAGVKGRDFQGPMFGKDCTLLSEIDLSTGVVRQTQIPMISPHAPMYLPDGRIFVLAAHAGRSLVLGKDHEVLMELTTPKGFVFGGHALILEDKGFIAIAVKKRHSNDFENAGFLDFYNLSDFKLVKRFPVPSTFAHDLVRLDSKTIVLSQYGTLNFDFQKTDKPFTNPEGVVFLMEVVKPMLSYFDLESFKFTHHHELKQFHGLNHIDVGPNGSIVAVSVQAVKKEKKSLDFVTSYYKDPNIVKQNSIDKSTHDDYLSLPSPIAVVSPSGKVTEYMGTPSLQIRSQDMVADRNASWAVSSFTNSGSIGVLRDGSNLKLHETAKWELPEPRGLCTMPQKNHIGVCDQMRGLAIINLDDMSVRASAKFNAHRIIHIDSREV